MKIRTSASHLPIIVIGTIMAIAGFTAPSSAIESAVPRSAFPGVISIAAIESHEMPPVDVEGLRAEDAERGSSGDPAPMRFAQDIQVAFTPDNSGTWESLADGSRLWRLRLSSPGALSLNLGLDIFDLPQGATFWVHAPDGSWVQGPYSRANRNALGGLWTAVVLGDEIVAELHLPKDAQADIEITSVNHGYRLFFDSSESAVSKRGDCNINVVCPQGDPWRDQIRSVAMITIVGTYACTGQLLNNTSEDETPYLLTAQHCIERESWAPTLVTYWNFQSPACPDSGGGNLSDNQSGSRWIASSEFESGSDFTLVELDHLPDPSYDVYYSGWDARFLIPDATTTIHHPSADEKSISSDNDPPTITSLGGTEIPGDGKYFRIDAWDEGTTEQGSSGGCLFDNATKRCVGTLSGGFASCDRPDEPDWYGRLFSHWFGDGTPETRLSDWLDPLNNWLDPVNSKNNYLDGKNTSQSEGAEVWFFPAAASLPGKGDANWKSQVSVANSWSSVAHNVTLYFIPSDEQWPGEAISGPHMVKPGQSVFLDDPLLPDHPTSGAMYASATGTGTAAFSRTYHLVDGGDTVGQGVPGIRLSEVSRDSELVIPMVHSAPGRYRTNVGFAQASSGKFSVWVQVHSPDGESIGERKITISTAWHQINDIFGKMGLGNEVVKGGWIRVTLVSGSPAYWTTYATVIDETTNDPTYVLPVAP
jgi:hypothetical protein